LHRDEFVLAGLADDAAVPAARLDACERDCLPGIFFGKGWQAALPR
jgi:hypothetical protein